RVCSPAPPPRIPPQTFTKPNNNDQSTPRLHPNSTTTAAAAAAAAGYSHRCAPPSPPPSCHRRIVARCSAPRRAAMLYPERPSRVNGTATVDCSAYPLDCHPVCPGGSCYEIAEPPPPSPVVPRVDVAVDDHHLPVRLLLTVSLLSAFLFISLSVSTILLYRRRVVLRRRRRAATAPLPGDDGHRGVPRRSWVGRGLRGVPRRVPRRGVGPPPPALLASVPCALHRHLAPRTRQLPALQIPSRRSLRSPRHGYRR
ncbi:hypothetical protein EE612_048419, partial [Oryza sativa]